MDSGLKDSRALVFGTTFGFGPTAARTSTAEATNRGLFARRKQKLHPTTGGCSHRCPVQIRAVAGDPADNRSVTKLIGAIVDCTLGIPVLNTPRSPSPMREFPARIYDEPCEDQLWSAIYLRGIFVSPDLGSSAPGRIIELVPASVNQPLIRPGISFACLAGNHTDPMHLSNEIYPHGAAVNAIAPVGIVTPHFDTVPSCLGPGVRPASQGMRNSRRFSPYRRISRAAPNRIYHRAAHPV